MAILEFRIYSRTSFESFSKDGEGGRLKARVIMTLYMPFVEGVPCSNVILIFFSDARSLPKFHTFPSGRISLG